jgi:hypothetical protein
MVFLGDISKRDASGRHPSYPQRVNLLRERLALSALLWERLALRAPTLWSALSMQVTFFFFFEVEALFGALVSTWNNLKNHSK